MFETETPDPPQTLDFSRSPDSPYKELLHGIDIFAKLNNEELDAVTRCIEERDCDAGTVMITEGESGEALYVILSGRVAVEKKRGGKESVRLAQLSRGAVFGEMSLIDNVPTSATVTTEEASSFIVISRMDLNVLLNWDTVLAAKMWRSFTEMLCHRVRHANERLLDRYGDDAKDGILATSGIVAGDAKATA